MVRAGPHREVARVAHQQVLARVDEAPVTHGEYARRVGSWLGLVFRVRVTVS